MKTSKTHTFSVLLCKQDYHSYPSHCIYTTPKRYSYFKDRPTRGTLQKSLPMHPSVITKLFSSLSQLFTLGKGSYFFRPPFCCRPSCAKTKKKSTDFSCSFSMQHLLSSIHLQALLILLVSLGCCQLETLY